MIAHCGVLLCIGIGTGIDLIVLEVLELVQPYFIVLANARANVCRSLI